jgi:uncharacterized protein (DUF1499 family)
MNILTILGIAAAVVAAGLAALAVMNPGNVAETSEAGKDKSLRPGRYQTDLETFIGETEKIIPTQKTYGQNWRLASSNLSEDWASIKAEVPVLFFTDDLEIKAETSQEPGEIIVNVRSASRVGHSDLGENRRHVRQILRALDKRFSSES